MASGRPRSAIPYVLAAIVTAAGAVAGGLILETRLKLPVGLALAALTLLGGTCAYWLSDDYEGRDTQRRSVRVLAAASIVVICVAVAIYANPTRSDGPSAGSGAQSVEIGPALSYNAQDVLARLEEVGPSEPHCDGASDGQLHIGTALPHSGDRSVVAAAEKGGAHLAVREINDDGGVLGKEVTIVDEDSGNDRATARAAVDSLLQSDVDMILGLSDSELSMSVMDRIVEACRVFFSPGDTSTEFTMYQDGGLHFRTVASDALLALEIVKAGLNDGTTSNGQGDPPVEGSTLAVIGPRNDRSLELLSYIRPAYEQAGGAQFEEILYDPNGDRQLADIQFAVERQPDFFLFLDSEWARNQLQELLTYDLSSKRRKIVLVERENVAGYYFPNESSVVSQAGQPLHIVGLYAGQPVYGEFRQEVLDKADPRLTSFGYAPEAYDAVIITALAAVEARSDNPAEIAHHINDVTRDGSPCRSFHECRVMIEAQIDINYEGEVFYGDFAVTGEPARIIASSITYNPETGQPF